MSSPSATPLVHVVSPEYVVNWPGFSGVGDLPLFSYASSSVDECAGAMVTSRGARRLRIALGSSLISEMSASRSFATAFKNSY